MKPFTSSAVQAFVDLAVFAEVGLHQVEGRIDAHERVAVRTQDQLDRTRDVALRRRASLRCRASPVRGIAPRARNMPYQLATCFSSRSAIWSAVCFSSILCAAMMSIGAAASKPTRPCDADDRVADIACRGRCRISNRWPRRRGWPRPCRRRALPFTAAISPSWKVIFRRSSAWAVTWLG